MADFRAREFSRRLLLDGKILPVQKMYLIKLNTIENLKNVVGFEKMFLKTLESHQMFDT